MVWASQLKPPLTTTEEKIGWQSMKGEDREKIMIHGNEICMLKGGPPLIYREMFGLRDGLPSAGAKEVNDAEGHHGGDSAKDSPHGPQRPI